MIRSAALSQSAITCPSCKHEFEPSAVQAEEIRRQIRDEFNQKWQEQRRKDEAEAVQLKESLRQKEAAADAALRQAEEEAAAARKRFDEDVKQKVEADCKAKEKELMLKVGKKVEEDNAAILEQARDEAERLTVKASEARQREVDFLKRLQEAEEAKAQMELKTQRMLMEEQQKIRESARKEEDERARLRDEQYTMKMRELEKQLDDQRRLAEEMKRKAEQGSMQLQGEVQELALEELLRAAFPFDNISEVPKGINGADCILTVRNKYGQECGCILFESKRTQAFNAEWITKLKKDMIPCNAHLAIIVSQALPKDMDRFGERQGVYLCTFMEVKSLVEVLRTHIIAHHELRKSQENKGDKMERLYEYLTSSEFIQKWNIMRENFQAFRNALMKEHDAYTKNYAKKQRMLESIINSSSMISGDFQAIAGMDSMDWSELPEEGRTMLLE